MKKITGQFICILSVCFLNLSAQAQYCGTDRYTEAPVFSKSQIKSSLNVVYGNAVNWKGQSQSLTLNVHYPKNSIDTAGKRPFILMVHGGSFLTGQKEGLNKMCIEFARRGYVAATLDYRMGWDTLSCADSLTYLKAAYRAVQDAHAALRYLTAHASTYKIDTAWMFTGGESAGSGTVLSLQYTSQAEINQAYPPVQALLGNINSSGNSLTNQFKIKAIFNNWGGIYSQFYDDSDLIPMISFHGRVDGVVPIDSAPDISCLIKKPLIYGSRTLHNKLVAAGKCSDLTVKNNGGHGIYNNNLSQDIFRIGRAACFFKSLFCNTCVTFYSTDSIAANCSSLHRLSQEMEEELTVSIYPNPASNELHLQITNAATDENLQITMYDMQGRNILQKQYDALKPIDISRLPEGLYIVLLKGKNIEMKKKVIIAR